METERYFVQNNNDRCPVAAVICHIVIVLQSPGDTAAWHRIRMIYHLVLLCQTGVVLITVRRKGASGDCMRSERSEAAARPISELGI